MLVYLSDPWHVCPVNTRQQGAFIPFYSVLYKLKLFLHKYACLNSFFFCTLRRLWNFSGRWLSYFRNNHLQGSSLIIIYGNSVAMSPALERGFPPLSHSSSSVKAKWLTECENPLEFYFSFFSSLLGMILNNFVRPKWWIGLACLNTTSSVDLKLNVSVHCSVRVQGEASAMVSSCLGTFSQGPLMAEVALLSLPLMRTQTTLWGSTLVISSKAN